MIRASEDFMSRATFQPKYQQLYDQLRSEIRTGRWAPGALFPNEAELVKSLGISRNTVRQALIQLVQDGAITRIQGQGTFVASTHRPHTKARPQLDILALVAPQIREGFYPSLIHGFEEACAEIQHPAIISNSGNDIGRQADLFFQLMDQSVGGIALVPTTAPTTPPHQIRQLQKNGIPVVLLHRTISGIDAPSVVFSGEEMGLNAGRELCKRGHRKIGFVFARRYSMVDSYELGLKKAFDEKNANCEIVPVPYGMDTPDLHRDAEKSIQKVVAEVLSGPDRPSAIFCGNASDAEIVYLQAIAMGLSVPDDLSLICINSAWREHGLAGKISSVVVDEHKIGSKAAQMLHDMRNGKMEIDSNDQIVFPASFQLGETLGSNKKVSA
jgi:GntR family transcriptional regulator, arabinose operon transcriptional repressor